MNNRRGISIRAQRLGTHTLLLIVGMVFVSACSRSASNAGNQFSGSSTASTPTANLSSAITVATAVSSSISMPALTVASANTPASPQITASSVGASMPVGIERQVEASCQSSELELGVGNRISEPTGQHTLSLTLTNRSSRSCSLFGYPKLALFDAAGHQLPFDYRQHGDQVVASDTPRRVDVSPGGTAYVTFNKYRCDLGDRAMASSVQLLLPDDATPLQVTLPSLSAISFGYCGPGDPGSIVSISPIASTFGDTITH